MIILPFEKVANLPTGMGGRAEILASSDLIDVMDRFKFQILRATNKPYYRGVSGYLFDAQIHMGFDKDYQITDVEVRHPFACLEDEGVVWRDLNLVRSTLREAHDILRNAGMATMATDVGFDVPDIGVSFFSNDYKDDLAVRLDAITVHMKRSA